MSKLHLWYRGLTSSKIANERYFVPNNMLINHWGLQVGDDMYEILKGADDEQGDLSDWLLLESRGQATRMEIATTLLPLDRVAELAKDNYNNGRYQVYGFFTRNCQAFVCSLLLAIFEDEGYDLTPNPKLNSLSFAMNEPTTKVYTIWQDIRRRKAGNIEQRLVHNAPAEDDESSSIRSSRSSLREGDYKTPTSVGMKKPYYRAKAAIVKRGRVGYVILESLLTGDSATLGASTRVLASSLGGAVGIWSGISLAVAGASLAHTALSSAKRKLRS